MVENAKKLALESTTHGRKGRRGTWSNSNNNNKNTLVSILDGDTEDEDEDEDEGAEDVIKELLRNSKYSYKDLKKKTESSVRNSNLI